MAMRKPRAGSLLRISLGDGIYAFARVLPNFQVAIYAYQSQKVDIPTSDVFDAQILWKLTVMKSALTSGRWPAVDYRLLEPELAAPVDYFMKDCFTGQFSVYRSSDGYIRASTFEECKMLEVAAVWEAEHVEDRLRDYFAGRTNPCAERLRAVP